MVPIYSIDSAISMWNAEHEWTVYDSHPLPPLNHHNSRVGLHPPSPLPISIPPLLARSYITVLRECYEGYVLYNFLRLMIFYCGGDACLLEWQDPNIITLNPF